MVKNIIELNQAADQIAKERQDLNTLPQLFIYWPMIRAALKLALIFIYRRKTRIWIHNIISWGDFSAEYRK